MAFADPLTLKDRSGSDRTFDSADNGNKPGSLRTDTGVALPEYAYLNIRHQDVGPKGSPARRHNATFTTGRTNASGVIEEGTFSASLTLPKSGAVSVNDAKDMLMSFIDLFATPGTVSLDDTAIQKWLRNEV